MVPHQTQSFCTHYLHVNIFFLQWAVLIQILAFRFELMNEPCDLTIFFFVSSDSHVCNSTRTMYQLADDKCSSFIDFIIDGYSLNKTKTFPGKTAQEINSLLTNPGPDLTCHFYKYVMRVQYTCSVNRIFLVLKIHACSYFRFPIKL